MALVFGRPLQGIGNDHFSSLVFEISHAEFSEDPLHEVRNIFVRF